MSCSEDPPYYVLVAHSSPLSNPAPTSSSLSHPVIEYHYADDSPRALLPHYPGEHVLVIDYDPNRGSSPTVKSLSADVAVTGLRITDAPGADELNRNNKMYILETTAVPEERVEENDCQSPQAVLTRFKQRNAILRRALEYPECLDDTQPSTTMNEER
ncbi:uncharacterized protein LAESUDRAFT_812554, partial [Laetiporus sulphureus 93-53]